MKNKKVVYSSGYVKSGNNNSELVSDKVNESGINPGCTYTHIYVCVCGFIYNIILHAYLIFSIKKQY